MFGVNQQLSLSFRIPEIYRQTFYDKKLEIQGIDYTVIFVDESGKFLSVHYDNEIGYYEQPAVTSIFFLQKRRLLIDISVWKVWI